MGSDKIFCSHCGSELIATNLEIKRKRSSRWFWVGPKRPTLFLACASCGLSVGWYDTKGPNPPLDYTIIKVDGETLITEQIQITNIDLLNKENVIAIIDGWPRINLVE